MAQLDEAIAALEENIRELSAGVFTGDVPYDDRAAMGKAAYDASRPAVTPPAPPAPPIPPTP